MQPFFAEKPCEICKILQKKEEPEKVDHLSR